MTNEEGAEYYNETMTMTKYVRINATPKDRFDFWAFMAALTASWLMAILILCGVAFIWEHV